MNAQCINISAAKHMMNNGNRGLRPNPIILRRSRRQLWETQIKNPIHFTTENIIFVDSCS